MRPSLSWFQAFATGKSAQQVVYRGVSRFCFISKSRCGPLVPVLANVTVPRPKRSLSLSNVPALWALHRKQLAKSS